MAVCAPTITNTITQELQLRFSIGKRQLWQEVTEGKKGGTIMLPLALSLACRLTARSRSCAAHGVQKRGQAIDGRRRKPRLVARPVQEG